jgi:hypothetical protein
MLIDLARSDLPTYIYLDVSQQSRTSGITRLLKKSQLSLITSDRVRRLMHLVGPLRQIKVVQNQARSVKAMSGITSRSRQRSKAPHVCIIGAGMAGLKCADTLLRKGVDVTVLEARNRIGGRVSLFQTND